MNRKQKTIIHLLTPNHYTMSIIQIKNVSSLLCEKKLSDKNLSDSRKKAV